MKDNLIHIPCEEMPIVLQTNFETAVKPFIHCDRTADFHVAVLLKSGKMSIIEDETEYTLEPNDIFFMKSGVHHYGRTPCDSGTKWYYAHFISNTPKDISTEFIKPVNINDNICLNIEDCNHFYTIPKIIRIPSGSKVSTKFSEMVKFHCSGNQPRANLTLSDILLECSEILSGDNNYTNQTTLLIKHFIDKNYDTIFTAKEIEDLVGLSYKYITTIFKQNTGLTIKEYQNSKRIQQAEFLLCSTNLSVAEISLRLGFNDQFYFSRVFKKVKGVSPLKYKNNYIPKI